jgi:small subunit ribosomal protein S35
MATFVRHFSRSLLQASRKTPVKRKCNSPWQCTTSGSRTFSTTNNCLAEDDAERKASAISTASSHKKSKPFTPADFTPQERADFEQLSKEEQAAELTRINAIQDALDSGELDGEIDADIAEMAREIDREVEPMRYLDYRAKGQEVGFWADDEDDEFGQVEDDDDDFSEEDITSVAHSELEVHREMREYARIVAWDMPLLKSRLGWSFCPYTQM